MTFNHILIKMKKGFHTHYIFNFVLINMCRFKQITFNMKNQVAEFIIDESCNQISTFILTSGRKPSPIFYCFNRYELTEIH